MGERKLHNSGLSEDTSTVLRDGGIDGNKIRKNSRNIGKYAETRVHIVVSFKEPYSTNMQERMDTEITNKNVIVEYEKGWDSNEN